RRGERCCVRHGGAQMHEERKNGGNGDGPENGGPEGSDYGEPGFATPGMGGGQATPMPGQSMPEPAEAEGGDEMPAMERPAARPRRKAARKSARKSAPRKKGGAKKK